MIHNQRPPTRGQGEGGGVGAVGGFPQGLPPPQAKSNKNTQHVPCKFFLQGQCQAGHSCPFSHDVESTTRPAPCKYFAKGSCKFGRRCALLHVTPDGTVVNRMQTGAGFNGNAPPPSQQQNGQFYGGNLPSPLAGGYQPGPPPPGLLSMQAQGLDMSLDYDSQPTAQGQMRNGYDIPGDMLSYSGAASPQYGSPPQHSRLASSPPHHPLSVLDAPLPGSFDSNGVSWAARHGPLAASVPSRFDIDSPPSSLPRKPLHGISALHSLRTSAYGDRGMDNLLASMTTGSSPPSGSDEPSPFAFEKRPLHSDRLRASTSRLNNLSSNHLISVSLDTRRPLPISSLSSSSHHTPIPHHPFSTSPTDPLDPLDQPPTPDREEGDLLPSSLHDLIPDDHPFSTSLPRTTQLPRPIGSPPTNSISTSISTSSRPQSSSLFSLAQQRRTQQPDSKVGSPSRYSGVFAAASQRAAAQNGSSTGANGAANANGIVGSPLRDAGFGVLASTSPRNGGGLDGGGVWGSGAGVGSAVWGSPPLSSSGRLGGMSMLTQELQRTKIGGGGGVGNGGIGSGMSTRVTSSASMAGGRVGLDRVASSTSVIGGLATPARIDEDQELFDMDGVHSPGVEMERHVLEKRNGGDVRSKSDGQFGVIGGQRGVK